MAQVTSKTPQHMRKPTIYWKNKKRNSNIKSCALNYNIFKEQKQ